MKNNNKNQIKKFYDKYKIIISNICFGVLLLVNLIAIPILLKKIINILHDNDWRDINPLSPVWYEQTKEALIFFEQQNINLIMACAIMASLLYNKYKKLAFLCLIIPSFYIIAQRII